MRLVSTVWADTLLPDEVDLDIRQGNGTWPGYLSMKLHDDVAVVLCGTRFWEQHGPFDQISDLLDWPRVQVLGFDDLWERLGRATTEPAAAEDAQADHGRHLGHRAVHRRRERDLDHRARAIRAGLRPQRDRRRRTTRGRGMRQNHYLLRPDDPKPPSGRAAAFTQWLQAQDLHDPPLVALATG